MNKISFGVRVPNSGPLSSIENIVGTAKSAEDMGFDAIWVHDHVVWSSEMHKHHISSGAFEAITDTIAQGIGRRRAEEALRLELRRQSLDRELARLRLIGGAALIGWIASVMVAVLRLNELTPVARGLSAAAWLLLLGSLGAAFTAQGRLAQAVTEPSPPADSGSGAALAIWMLIAGLAVAAIAILF